MAGYLSRFFAFVIDYLIILCFFILFCLLFYFFSHHFLEDKKLIIFFTFTLFCFNFCYFIIQPLFFERTIGRKLMKIKYLYTSTKKIDRFFSLLKLEMFINIFPFFFLFLYSIASYFNFLLVFFLDLYFLFSSFALICLISNLFFLKTISFLEKISHVIFVKAFFFDSKIKYKINKNNNKSIFQLFSSKIKNYE